MQLADGNSDNLSCQGGGRSDTCRTVLCRCSMAPAGRGGSSPGCRGRIGPSGRDSPGHRTVTTSERIDGGKAPGVEQDAPRKVALIANCLLNQNAKVCEGARYRGLVNPVVEALRSRGYQLLQLPCPELAFAGARRWWAVYEQYDAPTYRPHCRRPSQATAPLIEQHLRRGDEVILIGLDGSPSTG